VVLTGGSAKMDGVVELAEEVLNMPVRLGYPSKVTGLSDVVSNPVHSTGVGLLLFGNQYQSEHISEVPATGGFSDTLGRMSSWFVNKF